MPESEMSKRMTKAIKAIDKLIADILKDGFEVSKALRELKEHEKKEEK